MSINCKLFTELGHTVPEKYVSNVCRRLSKHGVSTQVGTHAIWFTSAPHNVISLPVFEYSQMFLTSTYALNRRAYCVSCYG
jgi:hypothetical protein